MFILEMILIPIVVSVISGIILIYIDKWLDSDD